MGLSLHESRVVRRLVSHTWSLSSRKYESAYAKGNRDAVHRMWFEGDLEINRRHLLAAKDYCQEKSVQTGGWRI